VESLGSHFITNSSSPDPVEGVLKNTHFSIHLFLHLLHLLHRQLIQFLFDHSSSLFPDLKKPCLLRASKCLIAFAFNFTERKTALLATFGVVLCKTELILCFLLNLKSKNIKYDVIATHSHISMYIIYIEIIPSTDPLSYLYIYHISRDLS